MSALASRIDAMSLDGDEDVDIDTDGDGAGEGEPGDGIPKLSPATSPSSSLELSQEAIDLEDLEEVAVSEHSQPIAKPIPPPPGMGMRIPPPLPKPVVTVPPRAPVAIPPVGKLPGMT